LDVHKEDIVKFEIEVPHLIFADLHNPSQELQHFIMCLQSFFGFLCKNFRTSGDRHIVSAFVRVNSGHVWESETGEWRQACFINNKPVLPPACAEDDDDEDGDEYDDEVGGFEGEPPPSKVVMDADEPGNWTVIRICIESNELNGEFPTFVTLHSRDFENGTAEKFFIRLIESLAAHAKTVPSLSKKLSAALSQLQ
jgi:hypothetical protein